MSAPELRVQRILREHGVEYLTRNYNIKARRHPSYRNLVGLKYNTVGRASSVEVVSVQKECRGLVLDESADWAVVASPYWRFFNHGERWADDVDWETAKVFEKVDGTLMIMYFYDGRWHVGTGGDPGASGGPAGSTFADLFWRTFDALGYKKPSRQHQDFCFMWELCTSKNRVVVQYDSDRLIVHGVRHRRTLQEHDPSLFAAPYSWELVKTWPLRSLDEVKRAAQALSGTAAEGYVVCDEQYRRVKIKSPQFVALAHTSAKNPGGDYTRRSLLNVVRANEQSEFLVYYPTLRPVFEEIRSEYEDLCDRLQAVADDERGASVDSAPRPPHLTDAERELVKGMLESDETSVRRYFAGLKKGWTIIRCLSTVPDKEVPVGGKGSVAGDGESKGGGGRYTATPPRGTAVAGAAGAAGAGHGAGAGAAAGATAGSGPVGAAATAEGAPRAGTSGAADTGECGTRVHMTKAQRREAELRRREAAEFDALLQEFAAADVADGGAEAQHKRPAHPKKGKKGKKGKKKKKGKR